MTSQGRSVPILEKLLSTSNCLGSITGINSDQTPEPFPNPLDSSHPFPRMNVETTRINGINDQTLAFGPFPGRNQAVPYFLNIARDNRSQTSAIFTQSSVGHDGLHYYQPSVLLYTGNIDYSPVPLSLSERTSIPIFGVPGLLLKVQPEEPSSWTMTPRLGLTDVYSPTNTIANLPLGNSAWSHPLNTTVQPSYNPASNRLRHLTLPFNPLPCQQDNHNPHSSFEQSYRLSHYSVPYLNQKEESSTISSSCFNQLSTLTKTTYCYSQPQMQASGGIPNQILSNVYHFLPQSMNPYLLETQANSQIYNEIQHANPDQSNSYLCNNGGHKLRHLSDNCTNTCTNKQPFVSLNRDTIRIRRNKKQEISENSMNTCPSHETTPLVHPPVNFNITEPCRKRSCLYEGNIKTSVQNFYENLEHETEPRNSDKRPSCLENKAGILENVNTQVDELTSSPKRLQKTSVEKWECPVCSRKLARASCLKIHMRQHSEDRPFKCPLCPRTFAQHTLFLSHRRAHNGQRLHLCPVCHKTFVHVGALKTHVNTHTGVRPHKCPVPNCGVAFTDSSTLAKHARVHSGERPYLCDICGRRFTQSGNMNKHRKTVHRTTDGLPVEKLWIPENTMLLSEILGNTEDKMSTAMTGI